ncbi:hypothetical protein FSP39_008947 [Pinctada imbricata]|uniref:ETS domain-containing protein n=1 Tax=Pinctada imbricata TaxID=66713 RepID=A0AA89CA91_PINIB|nr:hypothetical protein FSP39_008947 [Pinctada imbricata]
MMSLEEETIQLERCASPDIEWLSRILSPEIFSLETDSNLCHSHDGTKRKMLKLKSGYYGHREERLRRLVPRGCRLWEFIRDLLHNPRYNPSHIRWTDISRGEFRLIKTHDIARMWGEKKNNEGMTYEKLSRAMRYYYKRQILAPVLGKRLIYRFGPKSYGWN